MADAYLAKSLQGRIAAFVRCKDEVRIYRPDTIYEKLITVSHEKWEEYKQSYQERSDIALYDDTVNAAWQQLGFGDTIDRASARKLHLKLGCLFPTALARFL